MRIAGLSTSSIVAAAIAIIVLGAVGARLTELGPWYYELRKPSWQPPDWAFGPAWTIIFGCIGCSLVLAWNHATTDTQRATVVIAFGVNFLLNLGWSLFFFKRQRPDHALVEVAFFWMSIVALMIVVRPLSMTAMWLLVPYLLWVSFASLLNQRIVALNGPFSDY